MSKLKVAMNPWDFTLFKCEDSSYVMKVIFSEGDYKVDVERFFIVTAYILGFEDDIERLKEFSGKIRSDYDNFKPDEISKSDFNSL